MVATQSAVLPWDRQSIAGPPPPTRQTFGQTFGQTSGKARELALDAPKSPQDPQGAGDDDGFKPFGKEGFSFFDLIDVVNPLQHIPLIGTLYRGLTGDTIDPLPRIAGSTLFFGPVGAAFSTANVVLEEVSGQDAGEHIMTALKSGGVGFGAATAEAGAPAHAVSVVASEPAAVGTDAAAGFATDDPVSAWARGELAYRAELARGRNLADAGAAATPAPVQFTAPAPGKPTVPTTTDPARLSWANSPLVPTADATEARQPKSTAPDITRFTEALGRLSPATAASLAGEPSRSARPVPARAAGAYQNTTQSAARTQPSTGTDAQPPSTGAVAPGGGWFAANMMDAIARYQRQQSQGPLPATSGAAAQAFN